MKKIFLIIFLTFLYSINTITISEATIIDLSKVINIETAIKGKKLEEFFSDNALLLSFERKKIPSKKN